MSGTISLALKKGMTISELFEASFQSVPDKEVIFDGMRRLTYRDLETEATEIAGGLHQIGIKKGDRVALCLPTWYEFFVLFYAAAKIGAILVPINTRYRNEEVEHILQDSQPKVAFLTKAFDGVDNLAQFLAVKEHMKSLQLISVRFEHKGTISYQQLRKMGKGTEIPKTEIYPKEDVAAIIYTSGTTGKPKGAMLTHYNFIIRATLTTRPYSYDEVYLHAAVPYNHVMGLANILVVIAFEGKAVLMENYKPEPALQLVQQEKVTIRNGVPTVFILEMNHPSFTSYDVSTIWSVVMAATAIPPEVIRRVKAEYGCSVQVAYGLTEICAVGTMTALDDDEYTQSETVGKPEEGVEVKIVDDHRQEVAAGITGEIAFRSPGRMKGYYHAPEKTKEVLDDEGWLYTGDLGTKDSKGYIRIVGRKKEMIIRGGYNVYPREIEDAFYSHPSVQEAAVLSLPDTVLGEISCAVIQLKPGSTDTPEDLKRFIKERIADYKSPDHIIIVHDFPKTASGKIQKFILKEQIVNEKLVKLR